MTRVLLDTHVLLWFYEDDLKLSRIARALILDPTVDVYASVASLWELAVKTGLGRFTWDMPFDQQMSCMLDSAGATLLPIEIDHVDRLSRMPFHHRDPFDRMLISQAITEKLDVITVDEKFGLYPDVQIVW